jgi:hypothetical protein
MKANGFGPLLNFRWSTFHPRLRINGKLHQLSGLCGRWPISSIHLAKLVDWSFYGWQSLPLVTEVLNVTELTSAAIPPLAEPVEFSQGNYGRSGRNCCAGRAYDRFAAIATLRSPASLDSARKSTIETRNLVRRVAPTRG